MGAQLPGGWPAVMRYNHALAVSARRLVCEALEIAIPCPDDMIGTLAAIPIPVAPATPRPKPPWFLDPLQEILLRKHGIEVPVIPWA